MPTVEQLGIEVYVDSSRAGAPSVKNTQAALEGIEATGKRVSDRLTRDVERMNRALSTLGQSISGAGLAGGLNAASRAFSGLTSEFERQGKILERIRGPQRDYDLALRSLQHLMITGKITAEEYRKELGRMNDQARAAGVNIGSVVQGAQPKQGMIARGVGAIGRLNPIGADTFGGTEAIIKAAPVIAAGVAIAKLGDNYTVLQNKLRPLVSGQAELDSTMEALYDQAQALRLPLEGQVSGFSRVLRATKSLGLSQEETLKFTERLGMAIKISGATGAEASAGIVQLGQAMASGRLQGDELRSILENLPVVAETIARGMGVTTGELRKLGSEGKISARDIINAFEKADGTLRDQFGKTTATLGEQWDILKNSLTRAAGALVGFLDKIGVVKLLGLAFDGLVYVIDLTADAVTALGDALSWLGGKIADVVGAVADWIMEGETAWEMMDRMAKAQQKVGEASGQAAVQIANATDAMATQKTVMRALLDQVYRARDLAESTAANVKAGQIRDKVTEQIKIEEDLNNELEILQKARDQLRSEGHTKEALRIEGEIEAKKRELDVYDHEYEKTMRAAAAKDAEAAARKRHVKIIKEEESALADLVLEYARQAEKERIAVEHQTRLRTEVPGYDPNFPTGRQFAAEPWKVPDPMPQFTEFVDHFKELKEIGIDAWTGIADAMTDFIVKGELNFDRLIENIIQQLIRLAIMKALFGGGFDAQGKALGGLAGLLGFAHGGSFVVGGQGGTDSQVVAFRATPGERVSVATPSQQPGGDGGSSPTVVLRNVNVTDPAASLDVMRSGEGERVMINHIRKNAGAIRRLLR